MRPVNKGIAPKVYNNYQDAANDLQSRVGDFCSYCERQIETHLAVEHIKPKNHNPAFRTSWDNFLLACVNCNSRKGRRQLNINNYLWPDVDNTLLALKYTTGGLVGANPAAPRPIQNLASSTVKLVGLDNDPGNPDHKRRPTGKDRRWLKRYQVWQLAENSKLRLANNNTTELREQIVETALGRGLFSIWWTVFAGDQDMRQRLRISFIGTDGSSFDAHENLQPRRGGKI